MKATKLINKSVTFQEYTLTYSQWIDDGIIEDSYTLSFFSDYGRSICWPLHVPMKAKNITPDINLEDLTNKPTKREMERFLKKQIKINERAKSKINS